MSNRGETTKRRQSKHVWTASQLRVLRLMWANPWEYSRDQIEERLGVQTKVLADKVYSLRLGPRPDKGESHRERLVNKEPLAAVVARRRAVAADQRHRRALGFSEPVRVVGSSASGLPLRGVDALTRGLIDMALEQNDNERRIGHDRRPAGGGSKD